MTGTSMLAEIREQPAVLRELCRRAEAEWSLPKSFFRGVSQTVVVGSGSSFNAALAARLYLETLAKVATRADHACEAFRHNVPGRPLSSLLRCCLRATVPELARWRRRRAASVMRRG